MEKHNFFSEMYKICYINRKKKKHIFLLDVFKDTHLGKVKKCEFITITILNIVASGNEKGSAAAPYLPE